MDATKLNNKADIRAILHFPEAVGKHFAFLEGWGFKVIHVESTIVRYASNNVNINVFIGRSSFAIDAEFQGHNSDLIFYFIDILRLFSCPEAKTYRCYQADTAEGVACGVEILSDVFKKCLTANMFADVTLFSRLENQRNHLAKQYALKTELSQARQTVEYAWQKKDYACIVAVFKPLRSVLTASELLKLEYSEKKLKLRGIREQ